MRRATAKEVKVMVWTRFVFDLSLCKTNNLNSALWFTSRSRTYSRPSSWSFKVKVALNPTQLGSAWSWNGWQMSRRPRTEFIWEHKRYPSFLLDNNWKGQICLFLQWILFWRIRDVEVFPHLRWCIHAVAGFSGSQGRIYQRTQVCARSPPRACTLLPNIGRLWTTDQRCSYSRGKVHVPSCECHTNRKYEQ